ncbi:MAG: hypothetical protein ACOX5T_01230 [Candidatus Cryptobacteroides sp.]
MPKNKRLKAVAQETGSSRKATGFLPMILKLDSVRNVCVGCGTSEVKDGPARQGTLKSVKSAPR